MAGWDPVPSYRCPTCGQATARPIVPATPALVPATPPRLLKAYEMAGVLRCSVTTLRRYRKRGRITAGESYIVDPQSRLLLFDRERTIEELRRRSQGQ